MPELPEVETVRRGLEPAMEGQRFVEVEVRRGDLRWPLPKDFAQRLKGKTVTGLGRRAKYLVADLSSGDVLLMHLGMSGSFRVAQEVVEENGKQLGRYYHERGKAAPHDHIIFHMSSGASVTFNDPRRFGSMKLVARDKLDAEPLLKGLGPEPLGNEFDAAMLARACYGKKTSLKAALLDQRIVAGLGNIYVCEALYRAHLSPKRMASTHRRSEAARRTNAPRGWSRPSRPCCRMRSRPAARHCAITERPTANSACSSITFRFTIARASRAACRAAGHRQTHRAERPLDLLLSVMSKISAAEIRPNEQR